MNRWVRKAVAAMKAYVPGEQPRDPEVIKLNTNENPYPPSPGVAAVLRDFDAAQLRKYPDPLCMGLRTKFGALFGAGPEQVLAGNGSDEVLALALRALVERGGSVGWFEPSYSLYPVLADIEELEHRPVVLADGFRWRMPEDYEASLFFLTQPNAPVSLSFSRNEVEAFVRRFSGVVVIDEAYADFAEESFADLALQYSNVLVARTLSKSYALAGIRLGFALGPVPLIEALLRIKDSYNVNMLTQRLGEAALEDQSYMRRQTERIKVTREWARSALLELGFEVEVSSTNFLWARPPAGWVAEDVFAELKRRKILVRWFDTPGIRDFLRITIGTDAEMERLVNTVRELIDG